ncbi:hypothetical protein CNR22_17520 [Sphingobacteriaceae bacterium]|nr:hypothetical protein CNR22_17520 [Sphingobacteriaceae bacterium]
MNKLFFLSALLIIGISFSCKKNQLGGKSTVSGVVAHHSKPIARATVFIKFNTKEFPGSDTTAYDDKIRADENGNYSFKCYKGDYYLYGFGYDFGIDPPYTVVGGVPVHIRNKEDLEINVAVTED